MNIKYTLIIAAVLAVAGYAAGRWATPPKVEVKTEFVEKVVTRTDVQIVEHEVTAPDGTKTIDRTTVDKSTSSKASDAKSSTIVDNLPKWRVGVFGGVSLDDKETFYGASVERYVFKTISVGIMGTSRKELGVSVGFSF